MGGILVMCWLCRQCGEVGSVKQGSHDVEDANSRVFFL